VWKELGDHASLCARTDVAEVIARAAGVAVARLEQDRGAPIPKQFAALERDRLKRLVAEWLEIEKARTPFSVVQPEGERYAEVGGIRFRVKIDRIDRLPDGRELIIDYKTGTPSVHAWETDRPEEPQLPLYGSIHEPKPAGILFGQVKTGDSRFKGLVDETVVIPGADSLDLTAQVEAWRRVLLRLGSEFREGHAEAAPENPDKACRRCTLAGLCRIGDAHEWGVEEDER
jgi:RecB family exonuclease